ncbi:MAG: glycosyltransferase family 4 protein [Syntrophaceae bacterium]|nr:glycosyltransferase family 4 protein [Syntrophaceae bacterium]
MRIGYFVSSIGISGGVKVVLQHVKILKELGHEAFLITKDIEGTWDVSETLVILKRNNLEDIPDCEIYIGTRWNDVERLFRRKVGKVVHLCQGYEPLKYWLRIKEEFIPEKREKKGILSITKRYFDMMKYRRKIDQVKSVYALPTVKAAVSRHLVELIEKEYKQRCFLIQNGIDTKVFYPDGRRTWGEDGEIRVLSVGSMHVGFKGIRDTLAAVKLLKGKGFNLKLIRVSPTPPSERELDEAIVDEFYERLNEKEMADLYRSADIFISSSLEMEGFGLPAMEALASGVPSILTEISSYKNFDEKRDFAYFVPTHRPDKIAEGILAFIENRALRERCVQQGLRVAQNYTLETTREHLSNFLQGIV